MNQRWNSPKFLIGESYGTTRSAALADMLGNDGVQLNGVVLTMYDQRNNLCDLVAADVREHFGAKVFETMIPRNVRVAEAPSHGKPVLIYDHGCAGAQAYIRLGAEVLRRGGTAKR